MFNKKRKFDLFRAYFKCSVFSVFLIMQMNSCILMSCPPCWQTLQHKILPRYVYAEGERVVLLPSGAVTQHVDAPTLFLHLLFLLTEGLHGLDQFEGEGLVSGQLLEHAGDLIMSRPDDVPSVYALYVVAHTDHLHPVRNAALFDTLRRRDWKEKCNYREKTAHKTKIQIKIGEKTKQECAWLFVCEQNIQGNT